MLNYRAVLNDAPGVNPPQQLFANTQEECEKWGRGIIAGLTTEQKKTAYVRVLRVTEVKCMDIHSAKVDGEFAIARY